MRGFFRQYELVYVAADERDVVRLRTSFRGETVSLYRLTAPPEAARALLVQYFERDERPGRRRRPGTTRRPTAARPRSSATCKVVAPRSRFDWRLLANGRLYELAYEQGRVDTSLPLAELRARSDVTARAKGPCADRDDFSSCIREDLPQPAGRR